MISRRTFLLQAGAAALLAKCAPSGCGYNQPATYTPPAPYNPTTTSTTEYDVPAGYNPDTSYDLPTPIVYVTDIDHPYGDIDDFVDMGVAAGLNLDIRAVVFDLSNPNGSYQPPWSQFRQLSGVNWPGYVGVAPGRPTPLINILADVDEPVTVLTTGSCRDVADAVRHAPDLCRQKIARVVVFAGDYAVNAPVESNVSIDPAAFLTVMTSGLPVRWVPCFDGGLWSAGTHSSYVPTTRDRVFPTDMHPWLQRFFTYRLRVSTDDPLEWISSPPDAVDLQTLSSGGINLWCSELLASAVSDLGDVVYRGGKVAGFGLETVVFNDAGQVDQAGAHRVTVDVFRVSDAAGFKAAMIETTASALRRVGR